MSGSSVYKEVSEGDFPQPVIRQPRYTRWTLASVRAWLKQQAQHPDPEAAESTKAAEAQRQAHHQLMERAYHVSKGGPDQGQATGSARNWWCGQMTGTHLASAACQCRPGPICVTCAAWRVLLCRFLTRRRAAA